MTEVEPSPFVDALVGLASVSHRVDALIDRDEVGAILAANPELQDAMLGLRSLHATVQRLLAALVADAPDGASPDAAARWQREHLR